MGEKGQGSQFLEGDSLFINAFEYAPIGKALITDEGGFLKVNPAYCSFLGYTEDELRFKSYLSVTQPEDQKKSSANFLQLLKGEIPTYQMKKRYLHKDGQVLWGLLSCSVIRGGQGNPPIVIAQVVDITSLKKAEEELALAREHLESFIENTSDGIVVFDTDGYVLEVNPAFEKLVGWSADEIRGKCASIALGKTRDHSEYILMEVQKGNFVDGLETVLKCKNGQLVHVSITVSPIRDREGNTIAFAGTVRDIHTRKMMEAQLRENEQRYRLISETPMDISNGSLVSGGISLSTNRLGITWSCPRS